MSRETKYQKPIEGSFDEVLSTIANMGKPITSIAAKPFLKWVGGKRSILPELIKRLPKEYDNYYEPFLGGGALFFSIQREYAYLSDINFPLVITFQAVKDDVEGVIRNLKIHEENHSKKYYLEARERLAKEKNPAKIAALLIYLNKTCYNGLFRVNKAGEFNVPIGDYKKPNILNETNLRATSLVLQTAEIEQHDFSNLRPKLNCFYYLDPPYHETYDGYSGNGFADKEHEQLAEFCKKIDKAGGYFMLSNSDTPFIRKLYKGYTVEKVSASRSVSCKSHQRGRENELIIRNYK